MENRGTDTSDETNNTTKWEEVAPSSISTPPGHTDNSFAQLKNEPGSLDEDCLPNSNTSTQLKHIQYAAARIKLEKVSCDEGHLTYTEIYSSNNPLENASTFIKEEYVLNEEGDPAIYEPSYNGLSFFPNNLTPNPQIIDHNSKCLETTQFETSLASVETKTTCTPFVAAKSQVPNADSGVCLSDASPVISSKEGHVRSKLFACSKCRKCFSNQLRFFRHKRLHVDLGQKVGCGTEDNSAITDSAADQCDGKSPVWTGGGEELGTSTNDGSSPGSNCQTNPCENLKPSQVQDGGGKKSKTSPKISTPQISNLQLGCLNTLDTVNPWKFKKSFCAERREDFPFKSQLVLHQRNHLNKSQFFCSECGKCFTNNSHLVVHQRVHTGEKPFSCSVCPKRFATKSTLVIHQRVHTREKPYSCTECRKCFPCNSQLVIHQRTHTGEKPYSCLECGKGFISNSDLLRHRRVHTGERPFKCTECAKCFSQKSHLREHQKTHRR
ncbi:uncharacterized protein [Pyxicephalus adspersus]